MASPASRRVILWDLPINTSLHAVLAAISSSEGIIRASVFTNAVPGIASPLQTSREPSTASRCALIEFPSAASAAAYVSHIQQNRISLIGKRHALDTTQACRIQAYPAAGPSHAVDAVTSALLAGGRTRTLVLQNCRLDRIHDLLQSFGPALITDARLERRKTRDRELRVEFASVIEAERIYQLVAEGMYSELGIAGLINPSFGTDSTTRPLGSLCDGLVIDLPQDPVQESFDKPPFNLQQAVFPRFVPGQPAWHFAPITSTWCRPPQPSPYCPPDHDSGLDEWLATLHASPVTYTIVGYPSMTLTRKPETWEIAPEDQVALLMATTLHDPCYRSTWDDYFEGKGEVNRRKWEEYGWYAKQRRSTCLRWRQGSKPSWGQDVTRCACEVCVREKERARAGWLPKVIREWRAWKGHGTREFMAEEDEDLGIGWASSASEASEEYGREHEDSVLTHLGN